MATNSRDPIAFAGMAGLCAMACAAGFGASYLFDTEMMLSRSPTIFVYLGLSLLSVGFGVWALLNGRRGTFVMFSIVPALLFLTGFALQRLAA